MYRYWGFGLRILSEIAFPELLPFEFELPDVTIRLGKTPETLTGEEVVHKAIISLSAREYLLKITGMANYYAVDGREIMVELLIEDDIKSIRLFLLSNVFAAILHQRNLIPLHASGIFHKDGVVLFCGISGSGKSTLVGALKQRGYKVFTDDICVLMQDAHGHATVTSSYPVMKLWEDSFEKAGIAVAGGYDRIRPQLPKYGIPFHEAFMVIPQKVKQLFILKNNSPVKEVQITPLTSLQAFVEIQINSYRHAQVKAMQKRNIHFTLLNGLLKECEGRTYTAQRHRDYNTVDELVSLIEKNLF